MSNRFGWVVRDPQIVVLFLLLVLMIIGFSLASPYFFSVLNLTNILLSVSVIGVMAAVSTMVLVARGLDLSVGSIVGLVGVVAAMIFANGGHWSVAISAGLAVGAVCGAINGFLVVWIGINSIIATIGTLSIYRGLAYIVTEGQTIAVTDELVLALGAARIWVIPWAVVLMMAVFILCHVIAKYTRVGLTSYAIGANPRASRLSGIPVLRYRFWILVASGVSAAISGILLIGQAATAIPTAGIGYELLVITAVLLGGASLHGGEGKITGTLLGVLIIGILNNGMTLLGVNSYYQIVAHGVLLLLAVGLDQVRRGVKDE